MQYAFMEDPRVIQKLPSPKEADDSFLKSLGLQPEAFKVWLSHQSRLTMENKDWKQILRYYVKFCYGNFTWPEDPRQMLLGFGLNDEAMDMLLRDTGTLDESVMPGQYATAVFESKLHEKLLEHARCMLPELLDIESY